MSLTRTLSFLAILGSVLFSSALHAAPPAVATPAPPAAKPAAAPRHSAVIPEPRREAWWQLRHNSINHWAKRGPVELLFLGDSITQGWGKIIPPPKKKDSKDKVTADTPFEDFEGNASWKKHYASRKPLDAGIGGDQTQHVLWRIDHGLLDSIKPRVVVLMIGTNNSGDKGNTGEEIGEGVIAIIQKLRAKLPEAKILVLAIFPRGDDDPAYAKPTKGVVVTRARLGARNQKLVTANAMIAKAADGKMVYFMDIGPKFLDKNGQLPRDIMYDYLHLTAKGYEIWAESIEEKVAELLGEKR